MRIIQLIIVLHFSILSFGQAYLNDSTAFNEQVCVYSSALSVDSGTFVMGAIMTKDHLNNMQPLLAFYDNNGNSSLILADFDTLNSQNVHMTIGSMLINDRGNFVYFYQNCDTINCYPRIKEIDVSGNVINDVKLNILFDSIGLFLNPFNDFIQKKFDSTYIASAFVAYPGNSSSLYIHLDKDFNLLDTVLFIDSVTQWYYHYAEVEELEEGEILYAIYSPQNLPPNQLEERISFNKISKNGNVISSVFYEDANDEITLPRAFTKAEDGSFLFTYFGEKWISGSTFENYHYLCKVDSNFNFVWKKKIRPEAAVAYNEFRWNQEIKPTFDGNYVMAGAFPKPGYSNMVSYNAAQLTKFNEVGGFMWQRYIHLPLDTAQSIAVEIKDVVNTVDSGYIMVGQVIDFDVLNMGLPGQKGYIIKSNCLGFLGEPVAAANHVIENNFNVSFYNTSTQAGSYTWYFGDGQSLYTDEYTDTISHTYSGFGTYNIMLIAHGCYGIADTIEFEVIPSKHTDPTVITNGNGYFSIFPNPVLSGTELYVYLNGLDPSMGDIRLDIYTSNGRLAQKIPLTATEGTYIVNSSLSMGVYLLALFQGETFLEKAKLIVE